MIELSPDRIDISKKEKLEIIDKIISILEEKKVPNSRNEFEKVGLCFLVHKFTPKGKHFILFEDEMYYTLMEMGRFYLGSINRNTYDYEVRINFMKYIKSIVLKNKNNNL